MNVRRNSVALAMTVMVCVSTCVTARGDENWSRFRGPNGSGVSKDANLPAVWTANDYLWRVTLPGAGVSSPIGWGNRIFVTAGDAGTGELVVLAVDAAIGKTLWTHRYKLPTYPMHASNSLASSTPAADAERVYVAWASPASLQIVALTHSGDEVWRRDLGPVDFKHGFGASPIVVDDMVVMPCDNSGESFVAALDSHTGDVRWRRPRASGTESYATPAVCHAEDGAAQIVCDSTAEGMAALSPTDGSIIWQLPKVFEARCVASPIVAQDLVIGTSGEGGNGRNFAVIRPGRKGSDAEVVHELHRSIPQVVTPIADGELLFAWSDRGVATCCDVHSGKVHWSERIGGNFLGSPVVAGGKMYCVSAEGSAVVVAAGEKFEVLGRNDLGEHCESTPAIQGGRMYLRSGTSLVCLAP